MSTSLLTTWRGDARRGGVLVGVLVALSLLLMMVGAVVLAGGRDASQSADRLGALRAQYNAEAAAAMAVRELVVGSDIDGNGTVGTFAGLTLNGGTLASSATVNGQLTTVTATGLAGGSGGASAVQSQNRVSVRRASGESRPGLIGQVWFNAPTHPISNFNFAQTPQRVGWFPNVEYPNSSSGNNRMFQGHTANITVRWVGRVTLPTGGLWGFHADADDDVQVLVNGVSVLVRGGAGACERFNGSINLAAGTYSYELRWNDGSGSQCVTAYWTPPGGSLAVIPPTAFSHVPTEELVPLVVSTNAHMDGSGILVQGFRNSAGGWTGTPLADSGSVYTESTGGASVRLSGGARFEGRALTRPGSTPGAIVEVSGGSQLTGGASAGTRRHVVPRVLMPGNLNPSSLGSLSQWSGTRAFSGDARYSGIQIGGTAVVSVSGHARLRVDGNVTFLDSAAVNIPSGSSLTIYATGHLEVFNSARLNTSGDPDRLWIYLIGSGNATITDASRVHGHVRAPGGNASIFANGQANSEFVGTMMSNAFAASSPARIRLDVGPAVGGGGGGGGSAAVTSWVEP
jgi:hypothetical protein